MSSDSDIPKTNVPETNVPETHIVYSQSRGERDHQEDRFSVVCSPKYIHVAMFDGHGGKEVSELLEKRFINLLHRNQKAANFGSNQQVVQQTVTAIDQYLGKLPDLSEVGSTLLYVGISRTDDRVAVAGVGDSRVVGLTVDGEAVPMTEIDPKPSERSERKRLRRAGIRPEWDSDDEIYRVHGYAVSRAVGDHVAKQALISTIQYKEFLKSQFRFIVVATDGLWDAMTTESVCSFVRSKQKKKIPNREICQLLIRHAKKQEESTGDNITVIIIPLSEMKDFIHR